jgi:hypothetical protein
VTYQEKHLPDKAAQWTKLDVVEGRSRFLSRPDSRYGLLMQSVPSNQVSIRRLSTSSASQVRLPRSAAVPSRPDADFSVAHLPGFGYSFQSLRGHTDELYTAFKAMLGEEGCQ